jgi:hypothetical protein
MQRVIAASCQQAIHIDQVRYEAHLGRDQDAIMTETDFFGERRRAQGALQHRLDHDVSRVERFGGGSVFIHQAREEILIQRSPVHADANGLVVVERDLDDLPKVFVASFAADVPRIDAILGQGLCAGRVFREQQVAVVVEVPLSGTSTPASLTRRAISGTAAAASSLLTVIRTNCEPARARATTWSAVDAGSAVSVFVIDCTTIG